MEREEWDENSFSLGLHKNRYKFGKLLVTAVKDVDEGWGVKIFEKERCLLFNWYKTYKNNMLGQVLR